MCAALDDLAGRLGERFTPAPLLRRLAEEGRGFYDAAEAPAPLAEAVLLDMPAGG